jgi:zinc transporter ZupT
MAGERWSICGLTFSASASVGTLLAGVGWVIWKRRCYILDFLQQMPHAILIFLVISESQPPLHIMQSGVPSNRDSDSSN